MPLVEKLNVAEVSGRASVLFFLEPALPYGWSRRPETVLFKKAATDQGKECGASSPGWLMVMAL